MGKYVNDKFPHLIHGADYNPEQWAEYKGVWDEDMRLMRLANCNEMTLGIFSWAKIEPREGEYDFSYSRKDTAKTMLLSCGTFPTNTEENAIARFAKTHSATI